MNGRALILSERGEQNPYHFLFTMIPQFRQFDTGSNTIYYKYPFNHFQPFREQALASLPPRFIRLYDLSGFEVYEVAKKEDAVGIPLGESWVFNYVRHVYSDLTVTNSRKPRDYIYISRRSATCRRVLNETDLIPHLQERGVEILELNENFEDSVSRFRLASLIVGPHGAGLSFSVFSEAGTILFEINTPGFCQSHFSTLASECNLKYYRCTDLTKSGEDYLLDIPKFLESLDQHIAYIEFTYPLSRSPAQEASQHDSGASGSSSAPP